MNLYLLILFYRQTNEQSQTLSQPLRQTQRTINRRRLPLDKPERDEASDFEADDA